MVMEITLRIQLPEMGTEAHRSKSPPRPGRDPVTRWLHAAGFRINVFREVLPLCAGSAGAPELAEPGNFAMAARLRMHQVVRMISVDDSYQKFFYAERALPPSITAASL